MSAGKILTEHITPPIPIRQFDWRATREGYEPGDPVGYGWNKEEAIADLLNQEEERADDRC